MPDSIQQKLQSALLLVSAALSLGFGSLLVAAELPDLGQALWLDGSPSSARFLAAAKLNGTDNFTDSFLSQDVISLHAEVQVEQQHVNQIGNLFVIAEQDGQYLMRNQQGAFVDWDFQLHTLVPTVENKTLQASEVLTIVGDTEVGSLGLAGGQVSLYFAYEVSAAPGELIYSSIPLTFEFQDYQPLLNTRSTAEIIDTGFIDEAREREIPLLIYLPESQQPRPVILFSHGLGGSRFSSGYLGEHWSSRGYVGIFMQHRGSDSSILQGVPANQVLAVLNAAGSAVNSISRIEDVSAVIEQLYLWNDISSNELFGRLDLDRIGMSGHSYGARTTQAVSGEDITWIGPDTRDPRIKAAVPLSPSSPAGADLEAVFAGAVIPWLVMTGTLDTSVVGNTSVEDRLAVYPALPPGGKYELIFFEGEHHAFSDGQLRVDQNPRNPNHHSAIMALSTAFWDAWLLGYPDARSWLDGEGAQSVLEPMDSWLFK